MAPLDDGHLRPARDGVTLLELVGVIWRGKWIILGLTALLLVPAYLFARMQKPLYQSTSKFICKTSGQGGGEQLDLMSRLAGLRGGGGSAGDPSAYFNEILVDADFLAKFAGRKWPHRGDSLELHRIWEWKVDTSAPGWEKEVRKDQADALRTPKRLLLTKNRGNGVFVLDAFFESPELAMAVNAHLIQLLNDYIREDLLSNSRSKRVFIEERLKEVEGELRRSEDDLVAFQERNKDVFAPKLIAVQERLRRDRAIAQELFLQLRKEYEAARIDELRDQPLIEIISRPTLPDSPTKSKWRLLVPAAGLLGLLLGLALVLARRFVPWAALRAELSGRPAR